MTPAEIEDRLHDGMTRRAPGDEAVVRRLAQVLRLSPETRVLDVAAGVGASAPLLAREFGARVVAVDRDAAALDRLSFAARRLRVEHLVELVHAEEMSLDLGADLFDAVICDGAVARLGGPGAFLRRFAPSVKLGGGIAFTAICRLKGAEPAAVAGLGELRRPSHVLVDFVHARCEPLTAEAMSDSALVTWREQLAGNADAILAHTAPLPLIQAARQARRTAAELKSAGAVVAPVVFVGRKLADSGISPYFTRSREGA